MKNTGQILKSAREQQRVSVNEVAMATKISPRMIKAIENGDVNALPAKTFLRGFVQSYASYLKLNVDELLDTFHEEMGSTLPDATQTHRSPTVEEKDEKKSPPLLHDKGIWPKVLGGGAILLLVFLIVSVKNIVEKYEKEAEAPPAPTDISKIESTEATVAPEAKSTPETKPEPVEKTSATTAELEKTDETAVSAPTPQKTETPQPVAEAPATAPIEKPPEPSAPEKKPEETPPPITASEPPAPKPTVTTEPEKKPADTAANIGTRNEIIVEALDVVEIEFRVGDGELKRVTLKPDQIHTIKAIGPVTLDLSDGGAVNLIHNGRDKGVPGDLGKPKKVKIQ